MYNIGDKIVYPMHGAGDRVYRRKGDLGNKQSYYVVKIPTGEMKVMIPQRM